MASSTSTSGRLELIADGESSNTWGAKTNVNLTILDRMVGGYANIAIGGTTETLLAVDYVLGDWHNMALRLTGTLTANSVLVVPTFKKTYVIQNATTGSDPLSGIGYTLTVKTAAGTGIVVDRDQRAILHCDGINVVGTVIQPYSVNGTALGLLSGAGAPMRSSAGGWALRTLTGTAEQITVINGSGADGNPTFSLNPNLILPGTLQVPQRVTIVSGGLTVNAGGVNVQNGGIFMQGDSPQINMIGSSGFASMEMSGPSGAVIDLKAPASDDYDVRLITTGQGGELISASFLNLTAAAGQTIFFRQGNTQIGYINGTEFKLLGGRIGTATTANSDALLETTNQLRIWTQGVRGSTGHWAVKDETTGRDVLVATSDSGRVFANHGFSVTTNGADIAGGLSVSSGAVTFEQASVFLTRGISDFANTDTLFVRDGAVGIRASIPSAPLHIGNGADQQSSFIRYETGGAAGSRTWDAGTAYNDFNYIINDVTGGNRRLTISWQTGRTSINGGLDVTGTITSSDAITSRKNGGGNSFIINNPLNGNADGAQVLYNCQNFNVSTRVNQQNGNFEFINTNYTRTMLSIQQDGTLLNATGVYAAISDLRMKDHVETAPSHYDTIRNLRVVNYALKADARQGADRIGFVAQEVREVEPALVMDCGGTLAIKNSDLIPMLVSAFQTLADKVDARA